MRVRLLLLFSYILPLDTVAAQDAPAPIVIVDHTALEAAPVEPEPPTAEWHEGFYFRGAIGLGAFVDDFEADFGWVDATARGGSLALEIMVGGSLADGVVLGGGLVIEHVVDPAIEVENVPVDDAGVGVGTFGLIGPFLDWYPSPAGGFHLQALLGAARIDISDDSGARSEHTPVGAGLAIGAGYDFWIADEWSVGALLRISGATLTDDDVMHRVGTISLLGTVTYN